MPVKVNPKWQADMDTDILQCNKIDYTGSYLPAIQWLIERLSGYGRVYKLYNLGAGVRRITTDTDICPCCKQKIK